MATTDSLVTAVDDSQWNGFMTNDGNLTRIRDGEIATLTEFDNLSVPAGAIINGIEVIMEGYAEPAGLDAAVGDWIKVNNAGGFSTAQSVTTGDWSDDANALSVETAGGTSELWGQSWNTTTANNIAVRLSWPGSPGAAVYIDFVQVRVTFTLPNLTYPSDDNMHISNGVIVLNNGRLDIQ